MTAALLPLSLLWLCVACAFVCGRETAPSAGHTLSVSSPEPPGVEVTHGCGHCPFASLPKATAPERAAFDAGPQTTPADLPSAAASSEPPGGHFAFIRTRRQPPPAPTPLELLSTLRI